MASNPLSAGPLWVQASPFRAHITTHHPRRWPPLRTMTMEAEGQQQQAASGKALDDASEAGLALGEFRKVRARWQAEEEETIALLRSLADSLPVDERNCRRPILQDSSLLPSRGCHR